MRSIRLVRCLFTVMWPARVRRNHILLGLTGSRIAAPQAECDNPSFLTFSLHRPRDADGVVGQHRRPRHYPPGPRQRWKNLPSVAGPLSPQYRRGTSRPGNRRKNTFRRRNRVDDSVGGDLANARHARLGDKPVAQAVHCDGAYVYRCARSPDRRRRRSRARPSPPPSKSTRLP